PLEERAAELPEPGDVGVQVRRVEAEVLDPVVRGRVAWAQLLAGPRARDVHRDAAVLAHAADEPVAEDARLVGDDLEVEGRHVPVRRLAWIRRLQMDVIDPE